MTGTGAGEPAATPPLPIIKPALRFWSQRIDGRPFVNCLPYSICPALRWAGYDVPDTFGMDIRLAAGVPVAPGRGTSHADMKRGLRRLGFDVDTTSGDDAVVRFTAETDVALLELLPRRARPNRGSVVSVIARMERLPHYLRRHVGHTWEGLHGLTLYQRRRAPDGSWQVYYSDPMGRTWRGYQGEWVAWADLVPALHRNDAGLVRVVHCRRGTAR